MEGENGYLVPVGDDAALARAMTRFITEPDLVDVMGQASRELAVSRFDVELVTDSLLDVLELRDGGLPTFDPLPRLADSLRKRA